MNARDFTIEVGGVEVPCRLPFMPARMRLVYGEDAAAGIEDEDQRIYCLTCVYSAALAACLKVPPECGTIASYRGDIIAFGEAAGDELSEGDPKRLTDVAKAGRECLARILESIPTKAGEDAALDPTGAPAATSTDGSSGSA